MVKHFNLYYIFLWDKQQHPMPVEIKNKIKKEIMDRSEKYKPTQNTRPP